MVNERRWLTLIFVLYFLLAAGYSLLMPIWEAPDEPAHYHLAWHLARFDHYATPKINYEAGQPRGFYYLGSWVIRGLDTIDPDLSRYTLPEEREFNIRVREHRFEWNNENYRFLPGVYVLRWLNMLFGGIALWLNWITFKLLVPNRPNLRLAALALGALTPQYLHIMSSVNNDALGTLAGASLFHVGMRMAREPSNGLGALSIVLAILLPLVTKLTVLPLSVALLLILALKWLSGFQRKKWLLVSLAAVLIGAVIFFLVFPDLVRSAWHEINWRLFSLRKNAVTLGYLKLVLSQIVWTFWGKVGWIAVGLNVWLVNALTVLGLAGIFLSTVRLARTKAREEEFLTRLAVWSMAVLTMMAVIRNGLTTYATQGRFLFPALGALSVLMIGGWFDVLPEQMQRYAPWLVLIVMLGCNLGLWLTGIIPVYYQPFLD